MGRRGLGNGLEGKEKGGSLCAKKGKRRREVLGKVGGKGRGRRKNQKNSQVVSPLNLLPEEEEK